MYVYDLQMLGTAVFAITGVLAVNRQGLDVFGALVLGVVTALGGGTLRDMILGAPVFWLELQLRLGGRGGGACRVLSRPAIPSHVSRAALPGWDWSSLLRRRGRG